MAGMRDPLAMRRFQELQLARNDVGQDAASQFIPAAKEHNAYAYSRARENPITGPAEQMLLAPGYYAAKKLGIMGGRSEPSLAQVLAGWEGANRGARDNLGDLLVPDPIAKPPVVPPMSQGMSEQQIKDMVLRSYGRGPDQMAAALRGYGK